MDKCTHEVRKQRWKNIINQCLQRPNRHDCKTTFANRLTITGSEESVRKRMSLQLLQLIQHA